MARRTKVTAENFGDAIAELLDEYGQEVGWQMFKDVTAAGKTALREVKAGSPSKTGAYSGGWTQDVEMDRGGVTAIVHNAGRHHSLTHLLEKGHLNRDGSYTSGRLHIEPAGDAGERELMRRING